MSSRQLKKMHGETELKNEEDLSDIDNANETKKKQFINRYDLVKT